MSEWPIKTLGDLVTLQRGIDLPASRRIEGKVPIMGSFGITGYHDKAAMHGPGVTVGRSGASIGVVSYIDRDYWPLNTCLFVKDFHGNNPRFAYYLLRTLDLAHYNSGSAQPSLNRNYIHPIPLPFPDRREQDLIVELLGSLDDKIELNRRMNETLEAMARAIFKDWFVDFGPTRAKAEGRAPYLAPAIWELFPDGLDGQDKPAGWEKRSLGKLFSVSIGRTPPRKEREHFVPGGEGRTWLSIKTMGDLQTFAVASEEDLTPEAIKQFRVPLIPAGTVLVSFKLTVGRVAIAARDMHSNEAIAHLVAHEHTPVSNVFTYCFMKNFDYETLGSTSSIATAVNSQSIKAIEMIVPDADTHAGFQAMVQPLFDRILANVRECRTLSATRDLLLPKLMSGKIGLQEAEKVVEAVA
ncbi:restriction endonuclease subunit S [Pelagibius sp. CAU 1746]|uniref:restriction endonuclease subunit S n=1 Tax=Pelagibius sp. CAU 1746 TaxID=3140370 RepID=UPI00325C0B9D